MSANIRENLWYSDEHEWVLDLGDGTVKIGISDVAQHRLGDIVFVELPDLGTEVEAQDGIGTIESVKTVADLFTPVSGTVLEINAELEAAPELVNEEPYDGGWMVRIQLREDPAAAFSKLMDAKAYAEFLER
ncbi:MAG: glycine cleavage system protein GcvH [Paenibacillus macerans]|uniref:Glycine cleavage system H protein n=1 Tax=Paenibacillus macerans TaxID=44252 RepID=A0A090YUP6_PAEMA|nr:glycine cleavage system protein GcvH [Paenibacillus macerans]KFM95830.1 glycine cleavage system H protein [Paenibacillus macerans]MBS5914498.1 glycine cleavage system protein GcvH [Paenibacillus macerans]MCY7558834.1 glycine cleavage system protein GcvH [Paenibacillus macerans]MDU7477787.1 glycine cleavage system protein GcvH [Paenibacillus macerans]MEC0139798.1 glycine cleavage system protein GcvH [Paenibacillus macerans]